MKLHVLVLLLLVGMTTLTACQQPTESPLGDTEQDEEVHQNEQDEQDEDEQDEQDED